jgi:phage terminase large subunit
MGDPISTGLAIGQLAVTGVNAFVQKNQADRAADAAELAAQRQTKAVVGEVNRQQLEVNRIAAEQTSDRIRAANADLAAVRVAGMERGVSATTMAGLVRHVAYLEGADLSRIDKNRKANLEAGEAAKASAKNGFLESVAIADNQRNVATTSAILGTVGSGLAIGGNFYAQQQQLNTLQNRVG